MAVNSDLAYQRLRLAGWHLGEYACGSTWVVEGFLGENQIRATGTNQREAWQRAFEQAESIGLAGRAFY